MRGVAGIALVVGVGLTCPASALFVGRSGVLSPSHSAPSRNVRRGLTFMFTEGDKEKAATATEDESSFELKPTVRARTPERNGKSIVVTGGDGASFYAARSMFQELHDFGKYSSIVAASASVADTKKVLLSRNARYSGLLDVLSFTEAEFATAVGGADQWLCLNADASALPAQIATAAASGVARAFILVSADGPLSDVLQPEDIVAELEKSGMEYTLMRTGRLIDGATSGGGMKLSEVDLAVCEDVPKDEVFRFVTEALTLDAANGRAFSLCPTDSTTDMLKQMRLCGYERRDEINALLKGLIKEEEEAATVDASAADASTEDKELVMRSEAEVAAEREEELKALLAKARQRGEETQKKLAYDEAEKAEKRKEMEKYYKAPGSDDDSTPPPEA